jgi:hypothetical protein
VRTQERSGGSTCTLQVYLLAMASVRNAVSAQSRSLNTIRPHPRLYRKVAACADPDEDEFEKRLASLNKSKLPTGVSRRELKTATVKVPGMICECVIGVEVVPSFVAVVKVFDDVVVLWLKRIHQLPLLKSNCPLQIA